MKDFIQNNFPELLLSLIIVVLAVVLLFCIHWHDESAANWARNTIGAVIVGITTLINSLKQPKPNGSMNVETHEDKPKETK